MSFLRRDRGDAVASFDRRRHEWPGTRLRVRPGRFQVGIDVQEGRAIVTAWLQIDTEPGAVHYEVIAAGFNDPSHYGNQPIRASFAPTDPGEWVAHEQHHRWAASVWRGPAEGVREAVAWMHRRFAGMRVRVMVRCALVAPGAAPADGAAGDG
jgi:hypothetical protein